jgi:hypothetical protein
MEVLAVELMATEFVAAMKLVTAVKAATAMESPVPTDRHRAAVDPCDLFLHERVLAESGSACNRHRH